MSLSVIQFASRAMKRTGRTSSLGLFESGMLCGRASEALGGSPRNRNCIVVGTASTFQICQVPVMVFPSGDSVSVAFPDARVPLLERAVGELVLLGGIVTAVGDRALLARPLLLESRECGCRRLAAAGRRSPAPNRTATFPPTGESAGVASCCGCAAALLTWEINRAAAASGRIGLMARISNFMN